MSLIRDYLLAEVEAEWRRWGPVHRERPRTALDETNDLLRALIALTLVCAVLLAVLAWR